MLSQESNYSLTENDKNELDKLRNLLELSSGTTIVFAVTPEVSPQHTVAKTLHEYLETADESFDVYNFFYSEDSFHNFLYSLDDNKQVNSETKRKLVMAFGIDQLPTPRLVKEMKQLNLGREELFGRNLVLILWLNKNKFLDEFRQRAPDFWDWREKVVEFETRNPLLYPYLEWLIAENSYLKMSGIMQVNRQVDIFLDQVYVSLQAQWRKHITETSEDSLRTIQTVSISQSQTDNFDEMGMVQDDLDETYGYETLLEDSIPVASTKTVTQKITLSQAVRENSYSVILGAPGAGKTTLLRYLALHFAKAKRDNREIVVVGEEKEELGKNLLPVFFRIADFSEQLKQQPDLTLLEYLRQFYRQWEAHFQPDEEIGTHEEVAEFLLLRMRQGQCLMLLDGLDEVFDQQNRKQIVKCINQFVDEFPNNKFVITSRIAGYSDVQLSSRFAEFTIEDMDSEQVERFLYRWCHTVEKAQQPDASEEQWQRKADKQVQDILQSTEDNEGVKRLTTNPLLLTILALIHRNGDRLPNRRVKLYELAVQTLTEDWQLSKKLPDAPKVMLKETEVVELLAPLAYWMHEEKPSGVVSQEEVEQNLALKLAEINDDDPESESVRQAVGEFLRKVRETTGLFVEKTPGFYGFMHLTFEEYFVARYIADNDQSDILQLINNHLHEPRWDEPILLALGYYGVHFPRQVKKLVEKLFNNLEDYQPALQNGEIRIKNSSSDNPVISYFKEQDESENNSQEVDFQLKDLLFGGQVIAEIEVNSVFRKKLIRKLVITCLGIDADNFGDDTTKQLLRLLRKIEQFYQKNEVLDLLKESANDSTLSEEIRIAAKIAILYVACSNSAGLVDYVKEFVNELEPFLFFCTIFYVQTLGQDITDALEASRQYNLAEKGCQTALTFLRGVSYIRKDKYDLAISILEETNKQSNKSLRPFIDWGLAFCYQKNKEYEKANEYYNNAKISNDFINSAYFWFSWGKCQLDYRKYEESLKYYQKSLFIIKELGNLNYEAPVINIIGHLYQDWGKYEQAIDYYQQSRELYQQLSKNSNVASLWYSLANCYRLWSKYEQAVECQIECLTIRQQLNDQVNIADAYYQLGRIYKDWEQYQQAINYYQESKDIYQQLGRNKSVINHWSRLSECYLSWGKYEQAVECQNQCLTISQQINDQAGIAFAYFQLARIYQDWDKYEQAIECQNKDLEISQKLDNQTSIASAYYQLGTIYQDWNKYEKAVNCYQKSKDIYQQLGKDINVASQFNNIAYCYRLWDKYEQAIDYYQQSKDIYQQLSRDKDIASQWCLLANCYRDSKDYKKAIEYYQQSLVLYQKLDQYQSIAKRYQQIADSQISLAKNISNQTEISELLTQAEENINQAIKIDIKREYKKNLAYDYVVVSLLCSEYLRLTPNDSLRQEKITLFEEYYRKSFTHFDELGQAIKKSGQALDIARAYLEVEALENLEKSEEIAKESLQIFQEYNRRKLEAKARKLLGEIYQKRAHKNQPDAESIATQFLSQSLQIYQDLDLQEKALEVEQILYSN
ncbi:tetratricopeptide repeat protein [Calothrix sp. CCY 0018]|uniref:tetratricopeptide repeat protein n=1 Tax=Calothrix sp. CCY 0018 TaxID=3103864 RepID=UPI0039C66CC4